MAWIKTTQTSTAIIAQKYDSGQIGWEVVINDGGQQNEAEFGGRESSAAFLTSGGSTVNVNDGKWHLVTGTKSGTLWSIYVDGVLSNSQTQGTGASINASGNDVWVGAGPSAYFDGDIDDVRIYNCALSATEVQHLYLMGQ